MRNVRNECYAYDAYVICSEELLRLQITNTQGPSLKNC